MTAENQTQKAPSKIKNSKLLKIIGAFLLIFLIIFVGNKLNYQAKINQTLKQLDDPMISQDLLGMKLEEQYVSPESEWMKGKYTGPYVVNYFTKPSGKSDIEILNQIVALAEQNKWTVVETTTEYDVSLYAKKSALNLYVSIKDKNPRISPRSGAIHITIQRPTKL